MNTPPRGVTKMEIYASLLVAATHSLWEQILSHKSSLSFVSSEYWWNYFLSAEIVTLCRLAAKYFRCIHSLILEHSNCSNNAYNSCACYMSQHTTKPTIRHATRKDSDQPAHLQSDKSALITCAFYSLQTIQRINKNPCHTGWLTWVFAGYTGLIVSFVVRWLIFTIAIAPGKALFSDEK